MTTESNDAIEAIAGMSAAQIILEWERVHSITLPPSHRACSPAILHTECKSRPQVASTSALSVAYATSWCRPTAMAPCKRAIAKPSVKGRNFYASGVVRLSA